MPYEKAWEHVHEADRPQTRAVVETATNSVENGYWSGIYHVIRADGSAIWTSMCGQRINRRRLAGSELSYAIGVVIDITHINEKKEALHESERLRLALEAAQMGTFEADTLPARSSLMLKRLVFLAFQKACASSHARICETRSSR
jgi:PAS domain-containing protein